jgi:O-acetylserine/cysteine efflux transporter
MTPRDVALATLPPALWAITYVIAKPATAHFPPLLLIAMVYGLTAAMLVRRRWRTPFWTLLACGTFGGGVQSALIYAGIARVPATMTILVVQSQVPFAVLAAWALGQERLNPRRTAGIAVALAGVCLVVGLPDAVGETGGLLLIVFGTASWGAAQAVIRAGSRDSGSELMGAIALIAAPQLLVLSLILESDQVAALAHAGWVEWSMVLALAFGGYALPYAIWYSLLRRYRVDQITPFALLMPITGVLASAAILGERPSLMSLLGGVIILVGLALVVGLPQALSADGKAGQAKKAG